MTAGGIEVGVRARGIGVVEPGEMGMTRLIEKLFDI